MAKSKPKNTRTRSIGSTNSSKGSDSTRPASNVSVSSSSVSAKSKRSSKTPTKIKVKSTPLPPRTPEDTAPVDLDMDISPADTFDTVPLDQSPSRSFDSTTLSSQKPPPTKPSKQKRGDEEDGDADYLPVSYLNFESPQKGTTIQTKKNGNTQKVVIEHKMKDRGGSGGGSRSFANAMCLIKPLLLFLFIACVLAGAASVYGWLFKFPDLNRQVKELETEVTRLQAENDRYEDLNDRLNATTGDLEMVRDDLNGTVFQLESVASVLNTTTDQVVSVIEQLQGQNIEYSLLNQGLQNNVEDLAGEVNFFREALDDLSNEHSILQATTTALQGLAEEFSNTTVDQQETLAVLKDTLDGFQAENDRLEEFNEKLETGLNYLNETLFANGNLVESSAQTLTEISEVLGERVQQQQQSTVVQLEISYRQLLAGWDCGFNDVFSFGQGTIIAIDGGSLPVDVQNYLTDRVLSKLCLDYNDFERYLQATTSGGVIISDLIRAMVLYTEDAMKYYFPTDANSANGVSLQEWIDASFQCGLLESPFVSAQNVRGLHKFFYHLRH